MDFPLNFSFSFCHWSNRCNTEAWLECRRLGAAVAGTNLAPLSVAVLGSPRSKARRYWTWREIEIGWRKLYSVYIYIYVYIFIFTHAHTRLLPFDLVTLLYNIYTNPISNHHYRRPDLFFQIIETKGPIALPVQSLEVWTVLRSTRTPVTPPATNYIRLYGFDESNVFYFSSHGWIELFYVTSSKNIDCCI